MQVFIMKLACCFFLVSLQQADESAFKGFLGFARNYFLFNYCEQVCAQEANFSN